MGEFLFLYVLPVVYFMVIVFAFVRYYKSVFMYDYAIRQQCGFGGAKPSKEAHPYFFVCADLLAFWGVVTFFIDLGWWGWFVMGAPWLTMGIIANIHSEHFYNTVRPKKQLTNWLSIMLIVVGMYIAFTTDSESTNSLIGFLMLVGGVLGISWDDKKI